MNILEYCYYSQYFHILNFIYTQIKHQYKNEDFMKHCKENNFTGVYINIKNTVDIN